MSEALTLKATGVLPHGVPMLWPRIAEYLRPAVEREGSVSSMDSVLHNLCVGTQFLFVVYDGEAVHGAAVVEICNRPKARVCAVPFMGGNDFGAWSDLLENAITEWAKAGGCTVFEALVRRGLAKHYTSRGFTELGTVIRRAI